MLVKPFWKSTEFWLTLLVSYFMPYVIVAYNLGRGLSKVGTKYKDGYLSSEFYLSLAGLGFGYYLQDKWLIGLILGSYVINRGLHKVETPSKSHNVKISL